MVSLTCWPKQPSRRLCPPGEHYNSETIGQLIGPDTAQQSTSPRQPGSTALIRPLRQEFPKPPDLDLEFPGAPKAWLRAIQQWASKEEFIDAIYLFGSRLRGTFHKGSDLDLAILLSLKPSPDPERPYWRFNHERVDRELQELIPVETDVNVLHLTDWDDTTEYVRKEGLAIYVNPSPYPRG